ncbi:HD domain-containing protein [Desulfobulbus rhabdoformis]|uniref:HD-GYP domain-containing protein n=1 Tax=Desulfobulbus rhabdoformis TaxID=34032 RepID=UPI0019643240|nr:HD domain-containing phosphohydrolase [Desulfobulbus rhabdoformis]MBM9614242.1 HD domain-containing protein [Desulfobulbus rhabdoformis]
MQANLRQVIYALSDALDLVGVDDIAHGKRVGIMATACGQSLQMPPEELTFLFELGLLHDIGVSSTRMHKHLVEEFDWEGSQEHAETGWLLLRDFPPLESMALPIFYHHTRWQQLLSDEVEPRVAQRANLILLVDRVDALSAPYYGTNAILAHKETIREEIRKRTGTYFAPDLVTAFLNASRAEAFWLSLEPRSVQRFLQQQLIKAPPVAAPLEQLLYLARIFARIVDAKSPFTAAHSLGVSQLSRFLAHTLGLDSTTCCKIEIAGLLHDLGKLRVPDEILEKPGHLNSEELLSIHTHSFETFQILYSIEGFEEIASWAAYHHEAPDGSGYPFHLSGAELSREAMIIRVADIFQALAQDRPYREGLQAEAVLTVLEQLRQKGQLDDEILQVVRKHLDQAMAIACPVKDHAGKGESTRKKE